MSQSIYTSINPDTVSGTQLATILTNFKDAYVSSNSGTSRPSALQAGGTWLDLTNNPTSWTLKLYTGSVDIELFTISLANGVASVTANDSLFSIIKSSDDPVGAVLKFFKDRPTGNQTQDGDTLGEISFYGNRDTDVETLQARIKSVSSNNVTDTQQGAYLLFEGTTLNAASVSEWMRLVDGKLGIGITNPQDTLHVRGGIRVERSTDDNVGIRVVRKKKRFTGVGQVQSGDLIASELYYSTDEAGADATVASIQVAATETHTSTAQGTSYRLFTKDNGSNAFTEKITVDSNGVNIPALRVGNVSNAEINYLDGVTSNIQTQLGDLSTAISTAQTAANSYTDTKISELVDGAPAALDTLNELAAAINDDASYAATVTTALGNRLRVDTASQGLTGTEKTNAKINIDLQNVDNTSDLNKPVSTATQTALNLKTDRTSGEVITPTRLDVKQDTKANLTTYATTATNGQIVFATDTKEYFSIKDGALADLGGGSGVGGINYITNYSAESDTSGWATYVDAASATPVDGTGGTANVTWARSTTSPLRGTASFLFTKDAANRQGQGFSYSFSVDASDRGKVLQGSFDYQIASGTFADNDLSVWILDVTNNTLIQPAPYLIKNSGIIEKFFFEFQTAINSSSYRLIVHVASTSAVAYSVRFDNFSVGPASKLYGSAVTDLVDYGAYFVSNTQGFGAPTTGNGEITWSKLGPFVRLSGRFSSGVVAGSEARIPLPQGVTVSSQYYPNSIVGGKWWQNTGAASTRKNGAFLITPGLSYIRFTSDDYTQASSPNAVLNGSAVTSNSTSIWFDSGWLSIQGWSSSQIMSHDADTRVVAARVYKGASQSITNNVETKVTVDNSSFDRSGLFDSVNSRLTVKTPGTYRLSGSVSFASSSSNIRIAYIAKNGTISVGNQIQAISAGASTTVQVSDVFEAVAGDYFELWAYQNSGGSLNVNGTSSGTYLTLERLSGPSQIMASETVSCAYTSASGQSIANTTIVPVLFNTKVYDTHGAYNTTTGLFTAPISGIYSVHGSIDYTPNTTVGYRSIRANGAGVDRVLSQQSAGSVTQQVHGSATFRLLAGETISINALHSKGSAETLTVNHATNYMIINRVGNYV